MAAMEERIDDLLARATPAYGGDSWDAVTALLLADEDEREIVEHLAGVLRDEGRFQEPVIVDKNNDVCDGMHRIVAARLVGNVTIDVAEAYRGEDCERVDVTFELHSGRYQGDDLFDRAVGRLRSFDLDGTWTVCDALSGTGQTLSGSWNCQHQRLERLTAKIRERLDDVGIEASAMVAVVGNVTEDPQRHPTL